MPQLKYILPDWDDYLDWGFDFQTDEFSAIKQEDRELKYFHEICEEANLPPPYDGILVSLIQIEKKKGILKNHHHNGNNPGDRRTVRDLMRIPKSVSLVGDCGAFTYKDEKEPTITPEEAADLYEQYGFDIGASVDHMMIDEIQVTDSKGNTKTKPMSYHLLGNRVNLTRNNARRFINYIRENDYHVKPLGSIQARSPREYARVFLEYIEMGYREIALGSLIPKSDEEIEKVLKEVGRKYQELPADIQNDVHIHLFGILRPKLIPLYLKNGVSSFDSASYFRKAWLKSDKNYLGVNNEWYPAIRVPQTTLAKNRKMLEEQGILTRVANLERRVMAQLNAFNHNIDIDDTLDLIMEYDQYFERLADGGEVMREKYRRVLEDRPWEQCTCPMCQNAGINVLIFRGYNRNKRRGFHNTFVFYNNQLEGFENEVDA